jgi:OFA family oxalate/formate antiporter-like MFS transporter
VVRNLNVTEYGIVQTGQLKNYKIASIIIPIVVNATVGATSGFECIKTFSVPLKPMNEIKVLGLSAEKGRWLLIPLGIIVLLCLGTAYSWTIFRTPVQQTFQSSATDSLLPFTVLLVVFSILMPITGFYIGRFGPRRIVAVGAIIMGIGYILSGFANSIPAIVLTYGVIAGAGVGMVYGVPLAVVARWFPDKKGIAVGTTVIGFGLSPLITAPLANEMIKANSPDGWRNTLIIFGIVFTLIMLAIATTLKYPPEGWLPASWTPAVNTSGLPPTRGVPMLRTSTFWGLWLCFTIGTFAGLAAIGIARQVAEEVVKLDKAGIAWNVSLFAVFNGLGRPLFGWIADRFTSRYAAIAAFVLLLIASLIMVGTGEGAAFSYRFAFCLITLAFGGWLAIAPTSTLLLFRTEDYAKNYGIVFTAFGMGALLGTLTAGQVRDIFGSYSHFFYVTAALAIVGIVLAVFMLKRTPATSRTLEMVE